MFVECRVYRAHQFLEKRCQQYVRAKPGNVLDLLGNCERDAEMFQQTKFVNIIILNNNDHIKVHNFFWQVLNVSWVSRNAPAVGVGVVRHFGEKNVWCYITSS